MVCQKCGLRLPETSDFVRRAARASRGDSLLRRPFTKRRHRRNKFASGLQPPQYAAAGQPNYPGFVCPFCRVSRLSDCSEGSFERRLDFICRAPSLLPATLLVAIRHRRLQGRDAQMSVVWSEARVTRESIGLGNPPGWARASFVAYVVWNAAWLAVGRIPPSALRAILGIPCPTTGCTRSIVALVHGNLHASLVWNPFTTPILILLAVSLQTLLVAGLRKKELLLPRWLGNAWLGVLLAAWAAKFLLGSAYW